MAIRVDKKAIMAAMGQSGADLNNFETNLKKVEAYNSITDIAYDKGQKKIVVKFKNGNSSSFDVAAKDGAKVDPVVAENTVSVTQLVFFAGAKTTTADAHAKMTGNGMMFTQMVSVDNPTGTGPNPAPYTKDFQLFDQGPKGLSGKSYSETKAAAGKDTNSVSSTKYTKDGKRKVYDFGVAPLFSLSPTGLSASASVANIGIKGIALSASISNTGFDIAYIHGAGKIDKTAGQVSVFSGVKAKLCGIVLGIIPVLGLVSLLKAGTAANQSEADAMSNNTENEIR